ESEHLFGGVIPREDRAGQVLADDRILTRFDDRGQLSGILFDALLSGNVASDFGDADDLARRIPNGRDGDRYVEHGSIFSLPNRLAVLDAVPRAYPTEKVLFLCAATQWNDDVGRFFPENFCGPVAEYRFCASVPACDDSIEVLAVDRDIRRVEDGSKSERRLL